MARKIRATISPIGSIEVVPSGFKGEGCMDAVKGFSELGQVRSELDLPERFIEEEKERVVHES